MQETDAMASKYRYQRIKTIDYMKGFSMILILALHLGWVWRTEVDYGFTRFLFMFFDFFGPSMFVTLSVVGSMIGHYKREGKGIKELIPLHTVLKAVFLLAVGEVLNLLIDGARLGWYHVLSWNVISFVGVITLLMSFILRLDWRVRIVILAVIALSYYPLYNLGLDAVLAAGTSEAGIAAVHLQDPGVFMFHFLFNPTFMTPVFSWLMVPLVTSVVFEPLIKLSSRGYASTGDTRVPITPALMRRNLSMVGLAGIAILGFSIAIGLNLSMGFPGIMEDLTHPSSWYTWPLAEGVPSFWIRSTPQYLLYNFGILALMFYGLGYWEIVKGRRFFAEDRLCIFGILSLTGFLASTIGVIIPIKLPIAVFFLLFIPILLVLVQGFWLWSTRLKGVGTFEWMMVVFVSVVKRNAKNRFTKPHIPRMS